MAYCGINMTKLKYTMERVDDNRTPECKLHSYRHVIKVTVFMRAICSKLTTLLVNVSLQTHAFILQIHSDFCWENVYIFSKKESLRMTS